MVLPGGEPVVEKKYRILFHHAVAEIGDFKAGMAQIGVPEATVDYMITHAPVVLKGGMSLEDARRYADAVQEAGGRVTIDEDGFAQLSVHSKGKVHIAAYDDFTMCPICGLKQQRETNCIKCGFQFT